jgi:hypothetical protein
MKASSAIALAVVGVLALIGAGTLYLATARAPGIIARQALKGVVRESWDMTRPNVTPARPRKVIKKTVTHKHPRPRPRR